MGGHVEQSARLIAKGAGRKFAVRGYALVGNVNMVQNLLQDQDDRSYALYGYARGGYKERVNQLISEYFKNKGNEMAVEGYAHGGHLKELEKLQLSGGKPVMSTKVFE